MRNRYTDVFGAEPDSDHAILIKIKNAGELARSQGFVATLAQAALPSTIETQVYKKVIDELRGALSSKNVDVDVKMVDPAAWRPAGSTHLWQDIGIAIGGAGVLTIVLHFLLYRRKR